MPGWHSVWQERVSLKRSTTLKATSLRVYDRNLGIDYKLPETEKRKAEKSTGHIMSSFGLKKKRRKESMNPFLQILRTLDLFSHVYRKIWSNCSTVWKSPSTGFAKVWFFPCVQSTMPSQVSITGEPSPMCTLVCNIKLELTLKPFPRFADVRLLSCVDSSV